MKKYIFIGLLGFFTLGTTLTSCSSTENETEEQSSEVSYYCPMKCEGEKTYSEAGSCPTCGMDLVEKK